MIGSPSRKFDRSYEKRIFLSPESHKRSSPKTSSPGKRRRRSSSSAKKRITYSDRFIPSRSSSRLDFGYSDLTPSKDRNTKGGDQQNPDRNATSGSATTYNMLLQAEVLGIDANQVAAAQQIENVSRRARPPKLDARNGVARSPCSPINMLRYKTTKALNSKDRFRSAFSLSPLSSASRRLMSRPVKIKRKIAKVPFKVLDAPALQDDFYLNLVDWSSQNVLAVGLGSCVYLWSACTSKVTKLCDLGPDDLITSVAWSQRGHQMSVGTNKGEVQLWDTLACKKIRKMNGHSARVGTFLFFRFFLYTHTHTHIKSGTMAWNSNTLATGSRDRYIFHRDIRAAHSSVRKLSGHRQEVCGLKWSFDDQQLASGGNDNKLFIWDASSTSPLLRFNEHTAAVKAIAWSPHQHGLLASGGGTADRRIRFWNTLTGSSLSCVDTDSQVCNLTWSKNVNEIVSTHGYSLNQIIVWRYPSMTKVATLTGHTYRVLYLAMSPDGQTIVTGAGDETLRFWNVFPGPKNKEGGSAGTSLLFPSGSDIR